MNDGDKVKAKRRHGPELLTESALAENCRGWDGNTVFRLANGEVWEQAMPRIRALFLRRPDVRVWRFGEIYFLDVEGAHDPLRVRRVK